jgi:hypothetical protein
MVDAPDEDRNRTKDEPMHSVGGIGELQANPLLVIVINP